MSRRYAKPWTPTHWALAACLGALLAAPGCGGVPDVSDDASVRADSQSTEDAGSDADASVTFEDSPDTAVPDDVPVALDAITELDVVESMDATVPDAAHPVDVMMPRDTDTAHDVAPDVLHCAAPEVICSAHCVNTATTAADCGACGHACGTGALCVGGSCTLNAECPALHFPSVSIQTVPDATMTASYAGVASGSCYPLPHCFINLNQLEDPDTGRSLDVHVSISPHFELYELVATEIAGGYTHFALLSPNLITHLESLRAEEGGNPISIASGYRSPAHQAATCRSICAGGASCCPSAAHPCGCRSEHEFGDAADLSIPASEYTAYGTFAHAVHFPDCLLEAGSFHVDVSTCPLGCPYGF